MLTTQTLHAFNRFKIAGVETVLMYERGDYLAICSYQACSWGWVVYCKGAAMCGRRDRNMDAFRACAEAVGAMDSAAEAESRPYFAEEI
jgi:hypothetical protein